MKLGLALIRFPLAYLMWIKATTGHCSWNWWPSCRTWLKSRRADRRTVCRRRDGSRQQRLAAARQPRPVVAPRWRAKSPSARLAACGAAAPAWTEAFGVWCGCCLHARQCNAAVVRRQRVEPQETAAGSTREPLKTLFKNGIRGLYPPTENV